jgi:hypothetical protein
VNGICGCGSPAHCCQPAVAGGFIHVDLRGEVSTHLAPQALFTQSSPVCELLLQAFPFPSTLGEVTLHPLSQACMFIYISCGKWVFPPLLWRFPPITAFTSFPALDCWAFVAAPAGRCICLQLMWEVGLPPSVEFSSLCHFYKLSRSWLLGMCRCSCFLWPSLFIYSSVRDSPPPNSALRKPHPLCYVSFLLLLVITQFLFFSLDGGQSVQGAMLIWPRVVCGSTVYRLAHLVVRVFPSHLGTDVWRRPGTLLVSLFNVKWRCSAQPGGVEGSNFCLVSVVLPVR